MDQDLAWWVAIVFDGWQERPGPRYQRLAATLVDSVEARVVAPGARLPPERLLAAGLGVSRGTMVACFEHLVGAGVLHRRQGAGTFVAGRPGWTRQPPDTTAVQLLTRRLAGQQETIDLSLPVPASTDHLPPIDRDAYWARLEGHGVDHAGLAQLRDQIARHLTVRQQLPTTAEQIIVTTGAQQALALVHRALGAVPLITVCPTYPGLSGAFSPRSSPILTVPSDGAGADPEAVRRALRKAQGGALYLTPTGHNPTGSVMPLGRRASIAEAAAAHNVTVIEDLALADLALEEACPPPISALSPTAIAVGSASKLLWGGLRIGWVRAPEAVRSAVLRYKAANDLGSSAPSQVLTAQLLAAIDDRWLDDLRAALSARRDHLQSLLAAALPAWRAVTPRAGLSLWVELPVASADVFAHVASRHGVVVAPGSTMCHDGHHQNGIRLSFAEPLPTLELAVERLASAWEMYTSDLAAAPSRI